MADACTLARPYAKAAFEVARDSNALDEWQESIEQLVQVVLNPELSFLLKTPGVDLSAISALLIDILNEKNDAINNFIKALSDAKRLNVLPQILTLFEKYKARYESEVLVEITSAKKLSTQEIDMFKQALSKKFDRKVEIDNKIDESILGGAIIRSGDLVIDGSGLGALTSLKNYLKGNQVCN